ncbi:copper resistance protein CopC [Streptacidiphilus monticola]|uniref:Copper resistance protein CopC n=1 Tax=Streptacidiphilus monticola TaxID=2161674 RepID=A0ABW1G6Q6_9ACTN
MPTLFRRLAVLLAAVAALLFTAGGTASAHAALLSTDPAQGSVLATAPSAVTLHFSETVVLETDAIRVFDPAGKRVDNGASGHAGSDASTARVALSAALPQGTYTVAWRVVSADSHPVAGAFTFSFGHASATSVTAGPSSGDALVGFLYGASRTVQYAAFALLFGSVGLVLLCWPGGLRVRGIPRLALAGWTGLLVASIAQLLLRGPYEAGTGVGKAVDLTVLQQVLGERLGTLLVVRVLLLAAMGVFLALLGGALEDRRQRAGLGAGAALLAVGLACTWALGDHASVGMQAALAVPLDVVHLLGMGLWLGGLAAVWLGLRADMPVAAVNRFSRIALVCVTALVATGVYQSWRGVGSWGALTSTTYGRLLLVKVGLVLVILAAAWISRRWVALLRTDPTPAPVPTDPAPPHAEGERATDEAESPSGEAAAAVGADSRHGEVPLRASGTRPPQASGPEEMLRAEGTAVEGETETDATSTVCGSVEARAGHRPKTSALRAEGARATGEAGHGRGEAATSGTDEAAPSAEGAGSARAAAPVGGDSAHRAEGAAALGAAGAGRGEAADRAGGAAGSGGGGAPSTAEGGTGGGGVSAERKGQLERQARARAEAAVRREREAAPARSMLGRSVALEALFAVVVLVVTTLLTNSPPGRAVAEQQAAAAVKPVDVTLAYDTGGSTAGAKGKVTVDIDPARTGLNTVHVYLYDRTGRPVDVPEVDLSLSLPAKSLGPLNVQLTKLDIGHWGSTSLSLPLPGTWTLSTSIRSDDIDEATVTTAVTIG